MINLSMLVVSRAHTTNSNSSDSFIYSMLATVSFRIVQNLISGSLDAKYLFVYSPSFLCFSSCMFASCARLFGLCVWVCVWVIVYVCVISIFVRGEIRIPHKFSNSSPETILLSLPFCLMASHLSNGATGYDAISDMLKKGEIVCSYIYV